MISFFPNLKSSCMSLLGRAEITPQFMSDRTEHIRDRMLMELSQCDADMQSGIARRVRYALDAQGLWYVRSELMAVLSSAHGETIASRKIADITNLFQHLLPESLTATPASRRR
ncbi:MAG: hypothetical protein JWP47_2276 [Polaromonas sp.]|jgi:hypothetical protein|nr:hypothetical protein [Polaromonas sp.]